MLISALRVASDTFCLHLFLSGIKYPDIHSVMHKHCFKGILKCSLYKELGTQSALNSKGGSPHPPPVCSIHLDDATAAILRQNAHHTTAYWWRGDRVMKPISVWGWLGGHDGQRPVGKFGQDAGVTPLLFFEGHPEIFNDHRESGPRFKFSI